MIKNPISSMSPRLIRIIFSAAVLLALAASTLNVLEIMVFRATSNDQCAWRTIEGRANALLITDVVVGGVADKAGIRNGDILVPLPESNLAFC